VDDIYHYALKVLRRRDYSESQLREKLTFKFGSTPEEILETLRAKRFLDDRRYAENFTTKHADCHQEWIRTALEQAGIAQDLVAEVLSGRVWPSLRDVANAKMSALRLRPPLQGKDATRLFRALGRLGYPEDEIREELERLHE
jgi:SOS response regulatory protein OraA/RecX